jgi:hypothetical protein
MPTIVTTNAVIMCPHGGRAVLTPRQATTVVQGAPALCEPDLAGAPIVGCAQPPTPSTKPCTMVVSTLPGSTSLRITAAGRPVYLDTLTALTDGVPPGIATVVTSGTTVGAS